MNTRHTQTQTFPRTYQFYVKFYLTLSSKSPKNGESKMTLLSDLEQVTFPLFLLRKSRSLLCIYLFLLCQSVTPCALVDFVLYIDKVQ